MSRIVIDARNISTTTGRYAERLVHYLEELDKTNEYLVLVPTKDLSFHTPSNPHFKMVACDYPWYSFSEQLGFRRFLESLKPNLVHFCMPHQPVFFSRPHITTVHDLTLLKTYNSDKNFFVFRAKQLVGRYVFKAIAHTSAHIICPTHFVKNEYAKYAHIPPDKITVTYEGATTADVTAQAYTPLAGKKYIMYVGQQSDYKNIRRLMRAHQQLRIQHPDLLLVLVGSLSGKNGAPLVGNKKWAASQGFKGVIYTDFLPDPQLRWVYEHCQAYVFPSLMEGFGLPALEAMAAGAPVVSSNATCLPEVYGNAAHYFDPLSVEDMANTINDVVSNGDLRQQLIQRGRAQAATYSWRRMAEETLVIYNKVLGQ